MEIPSFVVPFIIGLFVGTVFASLYIFHRCNKGFCMVMWADQKYCDFMNRNLKKK